MGVNPTAKLTKLAEIAIEFPRDMWRFVSHNGYSPFVDRHTRLFYRILIETHTIEKGLSLEAPRPLFGRDKIRYVMDALDSYGREHSRLPVEMALGALASYLAFHEERGVEDELLASIRRFLQRWEAGGAFRTTGGVRPFEPPAGPPGSPGDLLGSRASCRMFDPAPLSDARLREIVTAAQAAPSQCNRQSSKVHVYRTRGTIDRLLALQGGSRGFSQNVGNLLVVSSEIAAWGGAPQRNQPYVDGALFAMALLLACHAQGLIACPLNLAITNARERSIRNEGGIPHGERLVMMIALGHPVPGPLRVARSPRRDVDEILSLHAADAEA